MSKNTKHFIDHYAYDPKSLSTLRRDVKKDVMDILEQGEIKYDKFRSYLLFRVLNHFPFLSSGNTIGKSCIANYISVLENFITSEENVKIKKGARYKYIFRVDSGLSKKAREDIYGIEAREEVMDELIEKML